MENSEVLPTEKIDPSDLQQYFLAFLSMLDHNGESRLPQRAYLAIRHGIRNLQLVPGQTILEKERWRRFWV